jgi:maleylpyruvate isomerase
MPAPDLPVATRLAATRHDIAACRQAHDDLLATVADLTDDRARADSELPGWTVGHVLTHLARNGDSVARLADAVAAGEIADQYPGGPAQREADIQAGAGRPAAELLADLRAVHARVDASWASVADERWLDGRVRTVSGRELPAWMLPGLRLREVVVHTSDLGLPTATWRDWPDAFVADELPRLLELLPARLDPSAARELVAQLMGRRDGSLDLPSVMW